MDLYRTLRLFLIQSPSIIISRWSLHNCHSKVEVQSSKNFSSTLVWSWKRQLTKQSVWWWRSCDTIINSRTATRLIFRWDYCWEWDKWSQQEVRWHIETHINLNLSDANSLLNVCFHGSLSAVNLEIIHVDFLGLKPRNMSSHLLSPLHMWSL